MYNFDQIVDRHGTNCYKWDMIAKQHGEDVLPMWVADMDFPVAPAIIDEMQRVLNYRNFGYSFTSDQYYEAVINWMKTRHHFDIEKEWIFHTPNVVSALCAAVKAVSEPGDEIIIMTPVYGPFFTSIKDNGRVIVESPMKCDNGYYTMDLDDFESRITEKTKATILCNPHNPVGRVWKREELQALADVCLKHGLYIISDDIHEDLVYAGHEHIHIASLSEEIADKCIVCTAPSKTFNLAGMLVAQCIVKNEALREKCKAVFGNLHLNGGNSFEEAMIIGAYTKSVDWLEELLVYLEANMDFFVNYVQENIPELTVYKPEGTYLVWLDATKLGMDQKALNEFLIQKCRLYVNEGTFFGDCGEGFFRMNMACPRAIVEEGVHRLEAGIKTLRG